MVDRRRSVARRASVSRRRDTLPHKREVLLTVQPDPRMTLIKIKKIGEGAQGTAHIVQDKRTGKQYVAKKTKNMIDTFRGRPYEAYILDELLPRHPNIIKLINYDYEPGDWRMQEEFDAIYDLCGGGDLSAIFDVHSGGYVPETFIWHVFGQLADALTLLHHGRDCHSRNGEPGQVYHGAKTVVHRDIKPDNVFLKTAYRKGMDPCDYPTVVLGDFGLATTVQYPSCGGTLLYMPPEHKSSRAGDVWSLGCVIHFLIFGRPPSQMPHPQRVMAHWEQDPSTRRVGYLPRFYSDKLDDMLMECLQRNPRMRIDSWSLLKRIRSLGF